MVVVDKNNIKDMNSEIVKNTKIDNIKYVNKYDNYYIIKNNKYVYVYDLEYIKIVNVNIDKLCNKDYDLIYRENKLLYIDDNNTKSGLVFKYYDAYTCELVDEVMVGGSYGQ